MLKNKQALQSLSIDDKALKILQKEKAKTLLSDIFWDKLQGLHNILLPISSALMKIESDTPQLSSVVSLFKNMLQEVKRNAIASPLLKKEEDGIVQAIENRTKFCVQPIHLAANLLDPRILGKDLSDEQNVDAFEKIHEMSVHMVDINETRIMSDLASYSSGRDFFSKPFLWTAVSSIAPQAWWLGLCKSTELAKIASRILELPATSAACEQSFSALGNIHTLRRNRLTTQNASKLLYIKQNLCLVEESSSVSLLSTLSKLPSDSFIEAATRHSEPGEDPLEVEAEAPNAPSCSYEAGGSKKRTFIEDEEAKMNDSDSEDFDIPYADDSEYSDEL
ncbi:UNVERIFIED_CONTAM: hypothetical protein GTU68_043368 [Idotea baltica]|nr:hypothetical protein [Idotea baltica]